MRKPRHAAVFAGLATAIALSLAVYGPIRQNPAYHHFADRRTMLGIPNFWNVVSNLAFLAVAFRGLSALQSETAFIERWERVAYSIVLAGIALVAFGSAWYHLDPNNSTLVWDRLPMTIVFMSLTALFIGDRVDLGLGRRLLAPLLIAGALSVLYWNWTGDLRPYVFVQFYPLLAFPLSMLLFRPRYTKSFALWGLVGFYSLAKALEAFDAQIGTFVPGGSHPWKHLAAAAGALCFVEMMRRRYPLAHR